MPDLRPSPADRARKLLARVRARGLREVGTLALTRVREAWRSEGILIFYVRDLEPGAPPEPPPGLRVRAARDADAVRYASDIGTDSPATFRGRLSRHTRCWLVLDGEGIVHATWTTTCGAWVREVARYFRPPGGDVYVYESFTRPEGRGRGAYPLVLQHLCRDAAAEGRSRAWVGVEAHNPSSARAVSKAGFSPAFEVSFRRRRGRLHVTAAAGKRAGECAGCLAAGPAERLFRGTSATT